MYPLKIVPFILLFIVSVSCNTSETDNPRAQDHPNIVFIFLDDLGYGDLGSYGNAGIDTPHMDQLADEGVRFKQFYVNSPVCSPSRVAVTTGQDPLQWEITSYLAAENLNERREMAQHLDLQAPSLARFLKDAGYYTAHVGKWHLGGQRDVQGAPLITEYGFDSSLTSFEGLGDRIGYTFETRDWNGDDRFPLSVQQKKLQRGDFEWVKRYNSQQIFVERTMEEIETAQKKNKPIYINLWTDAVHTPLEAPPGLRGDESIRSQYVGVIKELDNQLGRLFDMIRETPQLHENTLVILASDNGPSHAVGSAGGLRAHKGSLYEGGIREPLIVWSPSEIADAEKGMVNEESVLAGYDLPPSILSIAGISPPDSVEFDGIDQSNTLLGKTESEREEPIMWIRPPDFKGPNENWHELAIRDGKWKLLVNADGSDAELYNLDTNAAETVNLAEDHPGQVSDLQEKVISWFEETTGRTSTSIEPWRTDYEEL